MATDTLPAKAKALKIDHDRVGVGFMATAEIEGLVALLCREISLAHSEGDIAPDLAPALRGIVIRIGKMNSIAMSTLTEDEESRPTGSMYREVYGETMPA